MQASVYDNFGQKLIRIDPGPTYLNLDFFYDERQRSDFSEFFITRVTAMLAKKKR